MNKHIIRILAAVVTTGTLALAAPLATSAHVRVSPDSASAGSFSVLTFRVPTESATAGTVRLEVDFPTDTPFTSISYQPLAGWKAAVTTTTLPKPVKVEGTKVTSAPTKIVWTADPGVQVEPGQFEQFAVSAGPVPDTGKVMLPAIQTYSDGSVVRWDEPTPASGDEPEHPAPILYIGDPVPAADGSAIVSAAPTVTAVPGTTGTGDDASSAGAVAISLGIAGLTLGAIALVVAVLAFVRRPQTATGTNIPTADRDDE